VSWPQERLIAEAIEPVPGTVADHPYRIGDPILPGRFRWRGGEFDVAAVLDSWKELSQGSPAMPDRYVRKHWYRVRTGDGREMKIYVERRGRVRGRPKPGWQLFAIVES
jgi:hypothetical protein